MTFGSRDRRSPNASSPAASARWPSRTSGQTYYVCCTGCRDAFNENPEKIMKEFFARKKSGQ